MKIHVKQLGESTAVACKHLTRGMNDVQECAIDIADWAARVQTYINQELTSPDSKRLCPEIQYTKFSLDQDVFEPVPVGDECDAHYDASEDYGT